MSNSALLGVGFLLLSVVATFTMYQFWGYPYDEEARQSSCPQWKMNIHRVIGLLFVAVYVIFMIEMVPRLWTYQVEFSARTVAHICVAISIGVLLLVKISILRFFRHFEEWMPVLGTLIMLLTFVLVALSVPFVLKERALAGGAIGEGAFSAESRERIRRILPEAGFPEEVDVDALGTEDALRKGRRVLLNQCVHCHDLKTAIASPRTPSAWLRTVQRMAEKPSLGPPITLQDQHRVTAYLVAITPALQRSEKKRRRASLEHERDQVAAEKVLPRHGPERPEGGQSEPEEPEEAEEAVDRRVPKESRKSEPSGARRETPRRKPEPEERSPEDPSAADAQRVDSADAGVPDEGGQAGGRRDAGAEVSEPEAEPDENEGEARAAEAKATFESKCSLCHEVDDVHAAPPRSRDEARKLIRRMVDHGLSASDRELRLIEEHLVRTFVE